MYIGYLHDRKLLGYPALKDTSCGIKLVLITDSTVPSFLRYRSLPICKQTSLKCKGVSVLVFTFWFSNVQPSPAIGLSMPPAPVVRLEPSSHHDSGVKIAQVIPRKCF